MRIKSLIRLFLLNKKIKKKYPLSDLKLENSFDINRIKIGKYSYAHINIVSFNDISRISIGCFCSIAQQVKFIIDADHPINHISTYPFKVKALKIQSVEATSKGDIIIDDDVWIGYGATILSGVHIGQGAVIAAGSVVSKDIPPYSVVGGVPAKMIKKRFLDPVIDYMITLDYSKLDYNMIQTHIDDLYINVEKTDLDEIKKKYEWFPKKKV